MQASQRNTARRNDYSSLSTAVSSYVSNNNGKMPNDQASTASDAKVSKTWLNSTGKDPDGEDYTISVITCPKGTSTNCGASAPTRNGESTSSGTFQAYIIKNAYCSDGAPTYKIGIRNFVIYGYIENGANTNGTYCLQSNA